ncbi:MAG: T9SS type A sorting domain-containing protein [Parafilimonas sp.]
MKKKLLQFFMLFIAATAAVTTFAQANLKPVILGDSILCPNSGSTLHTQKIYNTYQWYVRDYFSEDKTLIKGATTNELVVTSDDVLKYFSVEVKLKGVKRTSDEKLIDGLVFIPPSVKSSGDFKNGPGFFALNIGDTGLFTLLKPYNTNITWYKNGQPIVGATSNKLYVTTAGTYTVKGAPAECPDYIQYLGVDLVVKTHISKPKITGDTLLCPNSKGTLQTDAGYDSYQWYRKWFGTNVKKLIAGATTNTLTLSSGHDVPAYYSVEVTKNGDTLTSKEQLVDAYVFATPSVLSGGDFINGPGYFKLNQGDTGIFTLLQPYDTNITWFKNDKPITGANQPTLNVTTGGNYTVVGAPSVCPKNSQSLGLELSVKLITASKTMDAVKAGLSGNTIKLYPNPAKDYALLDVSAFAGKNITVTITAQDGKTVFTKQYADAESNIKIDLANIKAGVYYVKAGDNLNQQNVKLVISK